MSVMACARGTTCVTRWARNVATAAGLATRDIIAGAVPPPAISAARVAPSEPMTAIVRRTDSNIAVPAIIVWSVIVAAAVAALKGEALSGGTAFVVVEFRLLGDKMRWNSVSMLCARAPKTWRPGAIAVENQDDKTHGRRSCSSGVRGCRGRNGADVGGPRKSADGNPLGKRRVVRNSVMAAAKAAPPKESQPSRNSMMSTPGSSNSPAMASQPSVAAVRGTAPR